MKVAVEPQEQRVAAELQKTALVFIGHEEDRFEAVADSVGDLLGAFTPLARKLFRELRETGDVDEDRCAIGDPPSTAGFVD